MKHVSKILYILQNVKSQKMLININIIKRVKKLKILHIICYVYVQLYLLFLYSTTIVRERTKFSKNKITILVFIIFYIREFTIYNFFILFYIL